MGFGVGHVGHTGVGHEAGGDVGQLGGFPGHAGQNLGGGLGHVGQTGVGQEGQVLGVRVVVDPVVSDDPPGDVDNVDPDTICEELRVVGVVEGVDVKLVAAVVVDEADVGVVVTVLGIVLGEEL